MYTEKRITFPSKWRTKGLSAWCVIERFKLTKYITNLDVKHWFERESGVVSADTEVLTNFINDKLGVDLMHEEQTYIDRHFNNTVLTGSHFKLSPDTLRYCIKCMQKGRHYVEQQVLPLTHCMYHPEQRLSSSRCPNEDCSHTLSSTQFLKKSKGENHRMPFNCACGHSFLPENKMGLYLYNEWSQAEDTDFYHFPEDKTYQGYSILNELELSDRQYIQLFTGELKFNQSSEHNIKYRARTRNYRKYEFQCHSEVLEDINRMALSYFGKKLSKTEGITIEDDFEIQTEVLFYKTLQNLDTSSFTLINHEIIDEYKDKYWLLKHYIMNEISNSFLNMNNSKQSPFLIKYNKNLKTISIKYNLV